MSGILRFGGQKKKNEFKHTTSDPGEVATGNIKRKMQQFLEIPLEKSNPVLKNAVKMAF